MSLQYHGLTIECVRGDIAAQAEFEAIGNAANAALMPGGGVAGAIHRAAGPDLAEECRPLGPIEPGEAVMTGGHDLPNEHVIHCLGPVYGRDHPADELLASCYRAALRLADENGLGSLAMPAISTGIFGYPVQEAARVAFGVLREMAPGLVNLRRFRFVLWAEEDLQVHEEVAAGIFGRG
jgi:O-acetyl-ADP-ribose deacetylase (regulator of RNase III)